MLTSIYLIIVILLCIVSYRSLAYGAAVFIVAHQIIPPIARFGSVSLNTLLIFILIAYASLKYAKNFNSYFKKSLSPVIFLSIPLFFIGVLAPMSILNQFKPLLQFTITELLPFTIIYLSIRNEDDLKKVIYILFLSFLAIGVYGIMTYVMKGNPYVLLVALQSGYEGDLYLGEFGAERGAMDGRATGNMTGALPWGQYSLLILLFSIFLSKKNIVNHKLLVLIVFVGFVNCMLTTKRSVMLPALLALLFYFVFTRRHLLRHSIKILLISLIISSVALQYSVVNEFYQSNIKTSLFFWNDKLADKHNIGGSNFEMRLEQTSALFEIVSQNFIQGNGFGFASEYSKNNRNSDMRSFESIFFQVMAESGFIGMIIWSLFFLRTYQYTGFVNRDKRNLLMFHGLYWLSLILTGIQSSLWAYMILCAFLYRYKEMEKEKIKKMKYEYRLNYNHSCL